MKTIHKYPLQITDVQRIKTHQGMTPLTVALDPLKSLCLWALVDINADEADVTIRVIGTGHQILDIPISYIGSVTMSPFVWHVFRDV